MLFTGKNIKKPIGPIKYAIREGIVQLDTWLLDIGNEVLPRPLHPFRYPSI